MFRCKRNITEIIFILFCRLEGLFIFLSFLPNTQKNRDSKLKDYEKIEQLQLIGLNFRKKSILDEQQALEESYKKRGEELPAPSKELFEKQLNEVETKIKNLNDQINKRKNPKGLTVSEQKYIQANSMPKIDNTGRNNGSGF